MSNGTAVGTNKTRRFLSNDFEVTDWATLEPYYQQLLDRPINNLAMLEDWLQDRSELDSAVGEDSRWRYIEMTRDTRNQDVSDRLQYFYQEIDPKLSAFNFQLNKKLVETPYLEELDQQQYFVFLRNVRKQIDLYREENLPIIKELRLKEKEYAVTIGGMTVQHDGKTLTMQQAGVYMKNPDRNVREEMYRKISDCWVAVRQQLDDLFDELMGLRQQIATNAGFSNYRDYKFASMGRFDYTPADCEDFQNSVADVVTPEMAKLLQQRQQKLGIDPMRPWDLDIDTSGRPALKPYANADELADKTINVLDSIDHYFAECLADMRQTGYLDLDSRLGKAPGGYNMSLPETGKAFIFMNSAGTDRDVKTMVHEAGHAVHTYLSHPLRLMYFRAYPAEVAELASMSMELFTMGHWGMFYADSDDLRQSQKQQLEGIIKVLPWIAIVDKFQHWLYTHPGHTQEERRKQWLSIYREFHKGDPTDWSGFEERLASLWHKQLHIFELPFYYIEYGMAQLGAVAMWRQMLQKGPQAIENYKNALALGYTRPIGEIYATAGIEFKFDKAYISELIDFLLAEQQKFEA